MNTTTKIEAAQETPTEAPVPIWLKLLTAFACAAIAFFLLGGAQPGLAGVIASLTGSFSHNLATAIEVVLEHVVHQHQARCKKRWSVTTTRIVALAGVAIAAAIAVPVGHVLMHA